MRLRRFTFRVDGFVSVRSGPDGGTIVTKPFVLNGSQLELNYIAWPRPAGKIRVEIQDANGEPLKGLTLNDCKPLRGDDIDAQQPKIGRGKSWVRSHPFWISGLAQNGALSDVVEYRGAGFIRPGGIATLALLKN